MCRLLYTSVILTFYLFSIPEILKSQYRIKNKNIKQVPVHYPVEIAVTKKTKRALSFDK